MGEFLGIENSALKFIIAFVLVMALIGLTAWLIRQFSSARPNSASGGRARQPRLAVLDSAVVDARRRLVLIRRDNVEHLLMIGGPTDVVVEANVVRAQSAAPAPAAPQQQRMAPQRAPIEPVEPDYDPSLVPLDEPYYEEPPAPPAPRPAPRPAAARPAPNLAQGPAHIQPPIPPQPQPRMAPSPQRPAPARPQPQAPQYSEMAQRLEAALRAPAPEGPVPPRPAPEPRMAPPPLRAEPQFSAPSPAAAAPAAPEKESKSGDVFMSLEEEMANLLKPGGKDPA